MAVRRCWACSTNSPGIVKQVETSNDPAFGTTGPKLRDALASLERSSKWLLERVTSAPNDALAGATPYLRLFGSTLGGCMLADEALAAKSNGDDRRRSAALCHAGKVLSPKTFRCRPLRWKRPSSTAPTPSTARTRYCWHSQTNYRPRSTFKIQAHLTRNAAKQEPPIPMFDFDRVIDRRGTHASKWDNDGQAFGDHGSGRHSDVGRRHGFCGASRRHGSAVRGRHPRRPWLLCRYRQLGGRARRMDGAPARLCHRPGVGQPDARRRLGPRPDPASRHRSGRRGRGVSTGLSRLPQDHPRQRPPHPRRATGAASGPLRDGPRCARRKSSRHAPRSYSSAARTIRAAPSGRQRKSARSPASAPNAI